MRDALTRTCVLLLNWATHSLPVSIRSLTTHLSASYYGLYWVPMLTLRSIRETGSQRWLLAPRLVAALPFAGFGSFFGVDIPSGQQLWSFAGDGDLTSAPHTVNQPIYIGSPFGIGH